MSLEEKIKYLGDLSFETEGAAFIIQFCKRKNMWKVYFQSIIKSRKILKPVPSFEKAIDEGIRFILERRTNLSIPHSYTLFK